MCKIRVEGRISSSNETELETSSFPNERDLSITPDARLAKVVNGVVGYYLDITGPVIATANDNRYILNFTSGSLMSCEKIQVAL